MLKEMKFGYDAHYLKILKENQMIGVLCFNIDHTQLSEYRAYIRHLTVTDTDLYAQVVKETANFIFNEVHADCIRADIHHFKESETEGAKICANPIVKDAFSMQRKGFKWKTMINKEDGVRF